MSVTSCQPLFFPVAAQGLRPCHSSEQRKKCGRRFFARSVFFPSRQPSFHSSAGLFYMVCRAIRFPSEIVPIRPEYVLRFPQKKSLLQLRIYFLLRLVVSDCPGYGNSKNLRHNERFLLF